MQQLLVRFDNHRTLVIDDLGDDDCSEDVILWHVSRRLKYCWKEQHLQVTHLDPPFCNVRIISSIRGGKGGFGTLLKGQSKQAAANVTKDFSACRDLQGRRLRHVNDEIDHRLWKEWNDKVNNGTATLDDMAAALIDTKSGIAGWHLNLPAWAEVSASKERRHMKRLMQNWRDEQEARRNRKQKARELQERQVSVYTQTAEQAVSKQEDIVRQALEQQQRQQQEEREAKKSKTTDEPPDALLTLSGDVMLNQESGRWRLESASNFCTVAIVLDQHKMTGSSSFYYEIALITGGLVQVGWAKRGFKPDSEAGDGVGDDACSWGYDGSRTIKFHNETTESYGKMWKKNDVVGCLFSNGSISYSLNGVDLGEAFQVNEALLFPAISCNPSEIIEFRIVANEVYYLPKFAIPVGSVQATESSTTTALESLFVGDEDEKPAAEDTTIAEAHEKEIEPEKEPTKPEPLDLDKFESIEDLEKLGLERLKSALMALELKCGGTLQQRAARLFSVRGLKPDEYTNKLRAKKP